MNFPPRHILADDWLWLVLITFYQQKLLVGLPLITQECQTFFLGILEIKPANQVTRQDAPDLHLSFDEAFQTFGTFCRRTFLLETFHSPRQDQLAAS